MRSSIDTDDAKSGVERIPHHIAIIMDGNGRWAKERGLMRIEGHKEGAKRVREIVEECRKIGVGYLTLFCFSTENWNRPESEISALMRLFSQYLSSEEKALIKNSIRLKVIGDISRLPYRIQKRISEVEKNTAEMRGLNLILAVSYGGRDEIVRAARKLCIKALEGEIAPDDITESSMRECMYLPDMPDPDLLIRTSGEQRVSNFLLWQIAYSEIVVSPVFWPAFTVSEFYKCLNDYARRNRRFGLTDEQIDNKCAEAAR
ncbi:MAG: isoprenyl transferase [Candidatus Dadabacteria bacterium]|nr:MAG: isoprenyl transferase [Candidatus Dadabacteria bacterium]